MGRGSSKAGGGRGGAGAGTARGSVQVGTETIEFDGDLKYGAKDPSLTGTARTNIENWEAKRVKGKIEYAYAVDANGNPIGESRGGKKSVRSPRAFHSTPDSHFTHIHPREGGELGGTFSSQDLYNFAYGGNKSCRAAAKEGTYAISKGANFDTNGFMAHISRSNKDFNDTYSGRQKKLNNDYFNGKIDYTTYSTQSTRAFNTSLVELHNAYLAGQKKYGYTYALEKR